ncbi:MAG: hypothetical protein J0M09_18205 [Xanthomonadales bacterium]|jgi:hypothetical protein|nr:hypothetical protein [Xanthomonadales bacterium]
MTALPANGRRIAGWACIAFGKIGSLMLLWALLTSSDTARASATNGGTNIVDSILTTLGVLPVLLMTLGIVALGLRLLLDSEGRRQPHGY